jgi:UDP-2-acetamido-2-deoxy-ribo-hexuluronate aminotransferase
VLTPTVPGGDASAWAQYSILVEDRDGLQRKLKDTGIPTGIYYPKPLHLQTTYLEMGHNIGDFPVSESVSERILSLTMHPCLDDPTIRFIVDQVGILL